MRRRFADAPDVAVLDALGGGEAGLEVGPEIARILEADREPDEPVADAERRGAPPPGGSRAS